MSYLGQAALKNSELKRFDVTSSTSATHVLSWTAPNEQSLWITINGVKQQDDAYSIAGSPTTITLTDPLVATDKMEVIGVLDIGVITMVGDNSVSTNKLANDAVTSAKIATGAVGTAEIATDAVDTAEIAANAVGIAELSATGTASATTFLRGDGAWQSADPAADSIVNSQIKSDAAIAQTKLANVAKFTRAGTAPTSPAPVTGDTWYDTATDAMKVWSGATWSFMGGLTSYTGGSYTTYTYNSVDYGVRTFTSSGVFGVTGSIGTIDFLVIAGGGGGGYDNGGGGGAGGVVWTTSAAIAVGNHTVTVGAGGAAGAASGPNPGVNGGTSTFSTATSVGGGGAGGAGAHGAAGGSGGGGSRNYAGGASTQGASGGTAFANIASASTNSSTEGGGGGGAGAAGTAGTSGNLGLGGIGVSTFINSSAAETSAFLFGAVAGTDSANVATDGSSTGTLYIAAGGIGGTQTAGRNPAVGTAGAAGGGGKRVDYNVATGVDGLVNTGSGGGSSGTGVGTGGIGGSGIVIIRWVI